MVFLWIGQHKVMPQPATTSAEQVEIFSVPLPSPPVPTISMALSGAVMPSALARITRAAAAISSTVSPRSRSAIRNAPIWAGVASPDMMVSNAASA